MIRVREIKYRIKGAVIVEDAVEGFTALVFVRLDRPHLVVDAFTLSRRAREREIVECSW